MRDHAALLTTEAKGGTWSRSEESPSARSRIYHSRTGQKALQRAIEGSGNLTDELRRRADGRAEMTVLIQPATTHFPIGPTCGVIETPPKRRRERAHRLRAGGRADGRTKKSHRKFCRGPAFNFRSGEGEAKGKERKEGEECDRRDRRREMGRVSK